MSKWIGIGAIFWAVGTTAFAGTTGAVFTATNDPRGNEIVVFARDNDGQLRRLSSVATGGKGSGGMLDPLASQGSLKLTGDSKWLLAVNAGSDEISVLKRKEAGLELVQTIASGGRMPVSLTIHGHVVYVLNTAGTSPGIAGFRLNANGHLSPLRGSTRIFPGVAPGSFAQVGFDVTGHMLVVTDKTDNSLLAFAIGSSGYPSAQALVSRSAGMTPFGFTFDARGRVLVVNAGSATVTSYSLGASLAFHEIGSSAPSGQKAACWIATTARGFVYSTNPGSASLSSYASNPVDGTVALIDAVAAHSTSPLDLAVVNDRFLYALDPMAGGINVFSVGDDGRLTSRGTVAGDLAVFAQGLAAD